MYAIFYDHTGYWDFIECTDLGEFKTEEEAWENCPNTGDCLYIVFEKEDFYD